MLGFKTLHHRIKIYASVFFQAATIPMPVRSRKHCCEYACTCTHDVLCIILYKNLHIFISYIFGCFLCLIFAFAKVASRSTSAW